MASSLTTRLQNLILPSQKWSTQLQIVRHKGGVKPHRKLRHLPRAPSKMFKLVPINHMPDQEINQILRLKYAHHEKMSALTQFLWEDYLINSDVGEAAKAKAQIEEAEHQKLLKLNEETNKQVALRREARVAEEAKEKEIQIAEELRVHGEMEKRRLELADQLVRDEIEDLKNVITDEESLLKAVQNALDNPIDYEYSIDLEGNIYHGRYTKATKVPEEQRKQIPTPMRQGQHILGLQNNQRQISNS